MMISASRTIETTYEYDDEGNLTKQHVSEFRNDTTPSVTTVYTSSDDDVDEGELLEGSINVMSPLEVLLTAAVGALFGNVLYRAIHKN